MVLEKTNKFVNSINIAADVSLGAVFAMKNEAKVTRNEVQQFSRCRELETMMRVAASTDY